MKNLEQKVIERIALLAFEQNKQREVLGIITSVEELDLKTICKLEVLFGEPILIVPTKQEWRKIKLEQLNRICNENL